MALNIQEADRPSNRLDQKRKSSCHIIIKTLNVQNREKLLKATWEKDQVTHKNGPSRIIPNFTMEILEAR